MAFTKTGECMSASKLKSQLPAKKRGGRGQYFFSAPGLWPVPVAAPPSNNAISLVGDSEVGTTTRVQRTAGRRRKGRRSLLQRWRWFKQVEHHQDPRRQTLSSKVMRRFEPNVDPESSELFAGLEQALSE